MPLQQPLDTALRELRELRIANGVDGRRARLAAEQRHLADGLAGAQLRERHFHSFAPSSGHAQAAAHDDEEAVAVQSPWRKSDLAAVQGDELELGIRDPPAPPDRRRRKAWLSAARSTDARGAAAGRSASTNASAALGTASVKRSNAARVSAGEPHRLARLTVASAASSRTRSSRRSGCRAGEVGQRRALPRAIEEGDAELSRRSRNTACRRARACRITRLAGPRATRVHLGPPASRSLTSGSVDRRRRSRAGDRTSSSSGAKESRSVDVIGGAISACWRGAAGRTDSAPESDATTGSGNPMTGRIRNCSR